MFNSNEERSLRSFFSRHSNIALTCSIEASAKPKFEADSLLREKVMRHAMGPLRSDVEQLEYLRKKQSCPKWQQYMNDDRRFLDPWLVENRPLLAGSNMKTSFIHRLKKSSFNINNKRFLKKLNEGDPSAGGGYLHLPEKYYEPSKLAKCGSGLFDSAPTTKFTKTINEIIDKEDKEFSSPSPPRRDPNKKTKFRDPSEVRAFAEKGRCASLPSLRPNISSPEPAVNKGDSNVSILLSKAKESEPPEPIQCSPEKKGSFIIKRPAKSLKSSSSLSQISTCHEIVSTGETLDKTPPKVASKVKAFPSKQSENKLKQMLNLPQVLVVSKLCTSVEQRTSLSVKKKKTTRRGIFPEKTFASKHSSPAATLLL